MTIPLRFLRGQYAVALPPVSHGLEVSASTRYLRSPYSERRYFAVYLCSACGARFPLAARGSAGKCRHAGGV